MITRNSSDNELIDAAISLLYHQASREGGFANQPPRDLCKVEGDYVILGYHGESPVVYKMMDVGNKVKLKALEVGDPDWAELVEYTDEE